MGTETRPRLHRAWVVFGGVCVYYFVAYGLLYSGFGLFLSPMSQELGIPYVQLSVTTTVRVLAGMVTTALIGTIFTKVRLRRFLAVSLLGLAGTILLVSVSSKMWQFIPAFAAMGLLCGLTLYGIVPMLLNQWFEAPAALITIATACGGAGGIVLCPLLSQVISHWGWRTGYHFMAALVLLVMLPIALFLFDLTPRARGLVPLANRGHKAADTSEAALIRSGGRAPPLIYGLTAAFFVVAALAGGMYIHISSALVSKGYTALQVSLLVSCFQAGSTLFQFAPGLLSARLGLRAVMNAALPAAAVGAGGLVFLGPAAGLPAAAVAVVLMGGGRMFTSLNPLLARYLFGQEGFHKAYPRLQSVFLVGTALTSIIYGGIYSATGAYTGTLWLMVGCLAGLLLLTQIIFGIVDRERVHKEYGNGGNSNAH